MSVSYICSDNSCDSVKQLDTVFINKETQCTFEEFLFDESPFAITFWRCEELCGLIRKHSEEQVSLIF